ncbi:MAG TPA: hypothetical protein VGF45_11400, partial [Polyangia bacterium]
MNSPARVAQSRLGAAVSFAALSFTLCQCGGSDLEASDEEAALARYFAAHPDVPGEHHTWHHRTELSDRTYG